MYPSVKIYSNLSDRKKILNLRPLVTRMGCTPPIWFCLSEFLTIFNFAEFLLVEVLFVHRALIGNGYYWVKCLLPLCLFNICSEYSARHHSISFSYYIYLSLSTFSFLSSLQNFSTTSFLYLPLSQLKLTYKIHNQYAFFLWVKYTPAGFPFLCRVDNLTGHWNLYISNENYVMQFNSCAMIWSHSNTKTTYR